MTRPIKVVDILTDRELALNAGAAEDLAVGDVMRILPSAPRQITDPETGEVLGEVVQAKAVVRVYEVQERFCLARTFRTRRVNVGGQGLGSANVFGRMFEAPRYETRVETLRRDATKGSPIDPEDSVVEIGDVAEKVDAEDTTDLPTMTLWR